MITSEGVASAISCVAVLGGTGQQGRGLAQRLGRAGVRVVVGSRDPVRAAATVVSWPSSAGQRIEIASNRDAAARADVAIVAVPFNTVAALLEDIGSRLRPGALIIDVTVPVSFVDGRLTVTEVEEGSAAEHVRARVPHTVGVAAAFKTLPAHLLGDVGQPLDCDEFVCGDSGEARTRAADLVRLLPGLRPIDVGPLSRARAIEQLTVLAIAINRRHKIHDARFRVVGLD